MHLRIHVGLTLLLIMPGYFFQHPKFDDIIRSLKLQQSGSTGELTDSSNGVCNISNVARLGKSEVRAHHCCALECFSKFESCMSDL